jgi:hypothetical protein
VLQRVLIVELGQSMQTPLPLLDVVPEQSSALLQDTTVIKLDYAYNPKRRPWNESTSKVFKIINGNRSRYKSILETFAPLQEKLAEIPVHSQATPTSPRWVNGWFPSLDSISLYGLLATKNPRYYVEVGSGNSTMFARQSIIDHGLRTSIVSIDPYPRADIDLICDRVIRQPCEDVSSEFFESLSAQDILFVDNSHRAFQNSDVTVFFTEILPNLPAGMIYGLHDILLPWDYPDEWRDRFYNEQYLLSAYLLGGAGGDEIILPNAFLAYYARELLEPIECILESKKLEGIEKTGGAFWMQRAQAI